MNNVLFRIGTACAGVTGLLAWGFPAGADTAAAPGTAAPIVVEHCTIDEANAIENPKIGYRVSRADGVIVAYRNERDVAATEVRFRVQYDGKPFTLVDRGSFGPHAAVQHEFTKLDLVYAGDEVACSVSAATFADGTHWDSPEPTASAAPNH